MTSRLKAIFAALRPSPDELIGASVGLAAATGFILAPSFVANDARGAIATWLLTSGVLEWVRGVHFWTAPLLIVGILLHLAASRPAASGRPARSRLAWLLVFLLTAYVAVAGLLLRGDAITEPLRHDWGQRLDHLPYTGGLLGTLLWGRTAEASLLYFQHGAAACVVVLAVMAFRQGVFTFRLRPLLATWLVVGGLALVVAPGLSDNAVQAGGLARACADVRVLGPLRTRVIPLATSRPARWKVRGRPESCLVCHAAVRGMGAGHDPTEIGCAACHRGDALSLNPTRAHRGMIRVPGNLADAPQTCGQSGCHEAVVPRVERSIMSTMAGVISVDRQIFGETTRASAPPHVRDLGHSAADTHLRQLCASCHLGQSKSEWGPPTEAARGGGCTACHLSYPPEAAAQLADYARAPRNSARPVPTAHPALTVNPPSANCFGCHSRSGRISTNYEGWVEAGSSAPVTPGPAGPASPRVLADGRTLTPVVADVHFERGLACIDCHGAADTMGKDLLVRRKYEQVRVRCEDCHTRAFATVAPAFADTETQTLLRLRRISLDPGTRLATTRSGEPLVNVTVDANGRGQLRLKGSGDARQLRPPGPECVRGGGHRRLSCASCHTAWAPRCVTCHTSFDPAGEVFDHVAQDWTKGEWREQGEAARVMPPTLGVRVDSADANGAGMIDTFIPGMIIDLNRNRRPGGPPDLVFQRLYARAAAHTTRRAARPCASCHADPVALGLGEGALSYVPRGRTGRWEFAPKYPLSPYDGLPMDAWTGFLADRHGTVSTRGDVRPLNADEQRRVLRVGACLTCHPGDSPVMQQAVADFTATLERRSRHCVIPE